MKKLRIQWIEGGPGNNDQNNRPLGNDDQNGSGPNGQPPKKQNVVIFVIAALVTLLCVSYFMKTVAGNTTKEISYNEFVQMVEEGTIESVEIGGDQITINPKSKENSDSPFAMLTQGTPTITYYTGKIEEDDTLTKRLLEHDIEVKGRVADGTSILMSVLLTYVLPVLLMWFLLSMLFRKMGKGGGMMGVGKNNPKVYAQKETGITFKDVAGEDEAKESLVEVVDFLHNPGRYVEIGARLPKGALLVGPPGTGKTLLAKAVAGEAHVPFFSLAGSDFIELYVGVAASRVRDLFR